MEQINKLYQLISSFFDKSKMMQATEQKLESEPENILADIPAEIKPAKKRSINVIIAPHSYDDKYILTRIDSEAEETIYLISHPVESHSDIEYTFRKQYAPKQEDN